MPDERIPDLQKKIARTDSLELPAALGVSYLTSDCSESYISASAMPPKYDEKKSAALAWSMLAIIKAGEADFPHTLPAARAAADKARKLEPKSSLHAIISGDIKLAQSDFRPAKEDFRQAADLEPENAMVHAKLADVNYGLGDFAEALRECTIAVKLEPKNYTYLAKLGVCKWAMGDRQGGVKDLESAMKNDPENEYIKMLYDDLQIRKNRIKVTEPSK